LNYKANKHRNIIGDSNEIVVLTIDTSKSTSFNIGYSNSDLYLDYNYINIDYGDENIISSSDKNTDKTFTHEYEKNSGLKIVTITGNNIKKISFRNSYNIVNIDEFYLPYLTDCSYLFSNCNYLATIPEGLFQYNISVTDFTGCFSNTSLATIPSNLFQYNTNVTNFTGCFSNCNNISTVPSNLFNNNTLVTDFSACFQNCYNLITIPSNLFQYNTLVTDFYYCFRDCTSLTTVPSNLFDNNTLVTNFASCFSSCSSITSSVPVLWNRTNVTSYTYCYRNCTKAANYSSIPTGWK
jgi:hypothetical protein